MLAVREQDTDPTNFMALFVALFGVPELNARTLKDSSFEDIMGLVDQKKDTLAWKGIDIQRKRALGDWVALYFDQ